VRGRDTQTAMGSPNSVSTRMFFRTLKILSDTEHRCPARFGKTTVSASDCDWPFGRLAGRPGPPATPNPNALPENRVLYAASPYRAPRLLDFES
jgi:hypothetical protein